MGEPDDGSRRKPKLRVLVVESPAAVMRPIGGALVSANLMPVLADVSGVALVAGKLAETRTQVVLAYLDSPAGVRARVAESALPVVVLVPDSDASSQRFAKSRGIPLVQLPRDTADLDWLALLRALERRAKEHEASVRAAAAAKSVAVRQLWPSTDPLPLGIERRTSASASLDPALEREVSFRLRARRHGRDWLGRPVYVDPEPLVPDDPTEPIGQPAKDLYVAGDLEGAEASLRGITDPDARVLAADIAKERERDAEAMTQVQLAAGERLETLGALERVGRWREATRRPKPVVRRATEVVPLACRGVAWTLVFEREPMLGRVGVAMNVPGAPSTPTEPSRPSTRPGLLKSPIPPTPEVAHPPDRDC